MKIKELMKKVGDPVEKTKKQWLVLSKEAEEGSSNVGKHIGKNQIGIEDGEMNPK